MDPNQQLYVRGRGRGRCLYQHPVPFHAKDGHPGPQREPFSLTIAERRASALQFINGLKFPSSEYTASKGRGIPKLPATFGDPSKRITYPDARPDNLRGRIRPAQNIPEALLYTRPKEIKSKVGTSGQKITCEANYFRLTKKPNWNIFQYEVYFQPNVLSLQLRRSLIRSQSEMLGGFLFDGTQIFLSRELNSECVKRVVKGLKDNTEYILFFRLTNVISMNEAYSLHVLNLILRRAMDGLHLQSVGKNKYDPAAAINVPNWRLKVWPGYITSIRQHEEDILLCAQISHKYMRNETVYDILKRLRNEKQNWKTKVDQLLLGTTVLTKYRNKTYRINEITHDMNPTSTFKMDGKNISYMEYYKQKYNLEIRDPNQPMLVSKVKKKYLYGGMESQDILLVPELCFASGLTEEMQSNYKTMRDMAQFTHLPPSARIERLLNFNERLRSSKRAVQLLNDWNLGLEKNLIEIPARILPYPKIIFGKDIKVEVDAQADWTTEFHKNPMAYCVDLNRLYIITPTRARRETENFVNQLQRAGRGMRFLIKNPRYAELENDLQTTVSETIAKCASENPQMLMCVVINDSSDRYATIKKRCYLDHGLPCQVILYKTICPKDKARGLMSIATKVAIQMNAKLGGIPWLIDVPLSGLMTCGYDVCHDTKKSDYSWGALVATMDIKAGNNQFFSAMNRHENGEELSNSLAINMGKAVLQFKQINGALPARILFYRDGVGDGQITYVSQHEVEIVKKALKKIYEQHGQSEVRFLYIIVTKRINTRIFFDGRNPNPGTCVDDVITCPEKYDFYLISQSVYQGTVTPTGYNIVHDTMGLPPDRIQQLTFRFTCFYFNYSGGIRVPAPCLYAHKLAYMASQSLQTAPQGPAARRIEQTLYFL